MNQSIQAKKELGKRTDAEIVLAAENLLNWTSSMDVRAIKVRVKDGVLTLTGTLDLPHKGLAIFSDLFDLPGVTGVNDRIETKHSESSILVKSEIEATLKRRIIRGIESIHVNVKDGVVALSGTVETWAERDVVTRACWSASGVRRVSDKLVLGR
jgi:osmotically-inducible protein OsmY